MSIADDPIKIRIEQIKEELDANIERTLTSTTIAGILSLIPGIGAAIQSLVDGKSKENVERRWIQLFIDLKDRLEAINDSIPDARYYGSEEFQTLLALAYEQLWTTHDRGKLKMLATALANSGSTPFQADDKELMLRALRTLSPTDIKTLHHENLKNWLPLTKRIEYGAEVLGSLSRLASLGLVMEKFLRPNPNVDANQRLQTVLDSPPWRTFQLSPFGERFLRFISEAVEDAQ